MALGVPAASCRPGRNGHIPPLPGAWRCLRRGLGQVRRPSQVGTKARIRSICVLSCFLAKLKALIRSRQKGRYTLSFSPVTKATDKTSLAARPRGICSNTADAACGYLRAYVLSCLPAKLKALIRSRQKAKTHAVVFASHYASRTADHPRAWWSICRGE